MREENDTMHDNGCSKSKVLAQEKSESIFKALRTVTKKVKGQSAGW